MITPRMEIDVLAQTSTVKLQQLFWVCDQFAAMGATQEEIQKEFDEMAQNQDYLNHNLELLDFKQTYLSDINSL